MKKIKQIHIRCEDDFLLRIKEVVRAIKSKGYKCDKSKLLRTALEYYYDCYKMASNNVDKLDMNDILLDYEQDEIE